MFDHDKAWAEETLRERGRVSQMFVIHCRDGRAIPVIQGGGGDDAKSATYEVVRLLCIAEDAVALASIGEAWVVIDPGNLQIRPSQSDRRREVLSVSFRGRIPLTGEPFSELSIREIGRSPDGGIAGLADIPELTSVMRSEGTVEGALVDLFPLEPASAPERRKARAAAERISKREKRGKAFRPH